jgi:hypothetical protein
MVVLSTVSNLSAIEFLPSEYTRSLHVHGSVHHNANLIEMTNKMQLCKTIYYFIVP